MFDHEFHISELISAQLRNQITAKQLEELDAWLKASVNNQIFYDEVINEQQFKNDLQKFQTPSRSSLWNKTSQKINADQLDKSTMAITFKTIKLWPHLFKYKTGTWITAAAILVAILSIIIILDRYTSEGRAREISAQSYANDIPAGGNKAFITLQNGKNIPLSSNKTGIIIDAKYLKYSDGTVVDSSSPQHLAMKELVITTPMGGSYQVVLPDGTRVWLNAASSIQFPSTFASFKNRRVKIRGEAYFEVTKDKRHPFIVTTTKQTIVVLGTHFNVNAYFDDASVKTTLLEGSVRVSRVALDLLKGESNEQGERILRQAQHDIILKPGEEAINNGNNLQIYPADTEQAVAWKNGEFVFKDEAIHSIMRRLSRWYNIEVQYKGDVSDLSFIGAVSKSKSLSAVLKIMESTGNVHFKIEGRRITVMR